WALADKVSSAPRTSWSAERSGSASGKGSLLLVGGVAAGEVAEGEGRADGAAGTPVALAGDRGDAVAGAVEAGDGVAVDAEDPGGPVGAGSALGVEGAGGEDDAVVRAGGGERPHGGVRPPGPLGLVPVLGDRDGAAAEVVVPTGGGEPGTAGAGGQLGQSGVEVGGQLAEGGPGHHVVDLLPREGQRAAAGGGVVGDGVVVDVEQQQVGVLEPAGVPFEVDLGSFVVGGLLVDHPPPVPVDVDHGVTERERHPGGHFGGTQRVLEDHLGPPGVAHVAELGADGQADADEVAGGGAGGAAAEDGAAEVLAAEVGVVGEPAGGEHDAAAGAGQDGATAGVGLHADDGAVAVAEDPDHPVAGDHREAPATAVVGEPVDQQRAAVGATGRQPLGDPPAPGGPVLGEVGGVVGGDRVEVDVGGPGGDEVLDGGGAVVVEGGEEVEVGGADAQVAVGRVEPVGVGRPGQVAQG